MGPVFPGVIRIAWLALLLFVVDERIVKAAPREIRKLSDHFYTVDDLQASSVELIVSQLRLMGCFCSSHGGNTSCRFAQVHYLIHPQSVGRSPHYYNASFV